MHRSFRSASRLASLGFGQDDRVRVFEKLTWRIAQVNDEFLPQRLKPIHFKSFIAGMKACSTP